MKVELWTDGACKGNPGPGGWAFILKAESGRRLEGSGGEKQTTNNRMELTAVLRGLGALKRPVDLTVLTDSAYVERAFNEDWIATWRRQDWQRRVKNRLEPVMNADLWSAILEMMDTKGLDAAKVTWRRVRGHDGVAENERCDHLAVSAVPSS
jgi:ribonuclease HI